MDERASGLAAAGIDEATVFRSLHAAYPDALLIVDGSGAIVLTNQAAENLLGYTSFELVGMNVDLLVPDAIRARHAAYRGAYAQSPRPRPMGAQMDLVAKRKDGSEVMVEIALSPLKTHGLPLVVAAIRDVGTYPRVRQALLRARYAQMLADIGVDAVDARDSQALFERAPHGVVEALQGGAALVLLLNADRQNFRVASSAGSLLKTIGPPQTSADVSTLAGYVLAHRKAAFSDDLASEHRFAVPPAYLAAGIQSALAVPIFDRGLQTGVVLALSDVARRFGDDEVRFMQSLSNMLASSLQRDQSEEALNHALRLESVGQLTGGIAHDFNNLLTVIQGNLQVLADMSAHADEQSQDLLAAATRASKRAAELTGKLLAFSRRQVLNPSQVDMTALLASLSNMLSRTLDQRISIATSVPGEPVVQADAGQLESALLNIAINARDAMPDGGALSFNCESLPALPEGLRADLDTDAAADVPFVAITVTDSGTGMPEAVKERAFEPFFTTKGAGRGTGLGLSAVYGFAKQSKGAVRITSAPGKGTSVTLYIPGAARLAPAPAEDGGAEESLPPGLSVLMVEDDPDIRIVASKFLEALRCRVHTCVNAEEALPVLGGAAAFDVLLTDISLGAGMRGTELAARAQAQRPQMAVLLMSGFSAELLDADSTSPPSWELLRKPYSREELKAALIRVLANRA